jgi:hypothetical protein
MEDGGEGGRSPKRLRTLPAEDEEESDGDGGARARARQALRGALPAAGAGLGAALWAMQQDGLFTDARLSVEGCEFRCHRAVLCAGSGLFRAMFTGGLRETTAQTAEIHDVSAASFAVVLRFLYTGEAPLGDVHAAEAVLLAADLLDVAPLRARSAAWIHDNLAPRDCARVWNTAEQLCVASLAKRTLEVACDHAQTLRHDQAFLSALKPQHMMELLQSDTLCLNSEDEAVELIHAWIQVDADARRALLAPLILHIRVTAVSPSVAAALLQQLAAEGERESRCAEGAAGCEATSCQSLLASTHAALSTFVVVTQGGLPAEASEGSAEDGGAGVMGMGQGGGAGLALIPDQWQKTSKVSALVHMLIKPPAS